MRKWSINQLYNLGLVLNGFFGGDRHETLSARWGRIGRKVQIWHWVCRLLNILDKRHCETAAEHFARIKSVREK